MTKEKTKFIQSIYIPASFVLVIIIVKIIEFILGISFVNLGLYPRTIHGLLGIITSPLLHSNIEHLFSNYYIRGLLQNARKNSVNKKYIKFYQCLKIRQNG